MSRLLVILSLLWFVPAQAQNSDSIFKHVYFRNIGPFRGGAQFVQVAQWVIRWFIIWVPQEGAVEDGRCGHYLAEHFRRILYHRLGWCSCRVGKRSEHCLRRHG